MIVCSPGSSYSHFAAGKNPAEFAGFMIQLPMQNGGGAELLVTARGTNSSHSMTVSSDVRFHAVTWLTGAHVEACSTSTLCIFLHYA